MSSPAEKARPEPVKTTTRTESSICAWSSGSTRSRFIAWVMPFGRSGSLDGTSAIPGWCAESSKPVSFPWRMALGVDARARVAGAHLLAVLVGGDHVEVDEVLAALAAQRLHGRLRGERVARPDLRDEAHAVLGEPAVADPIGEHAAGRAHRE